MRILAAVCAVFALLTLPQAWTGGSAEGKSVERFSMGCNHECFNYCYVFSGQAKDGRYLLSANCFAGPMREIRYELKGAELTAEEWQKITAIIMSDEWQKILNPSFVSKARKAVREKMASDDLEPLDATTYSFSVTYDDGTRQRTDRCLGELEAYLLELVPQKAA